MSREQKLTDEILRDLADEMRQCFGEDYIPLSKAQSAATKKCSDLVVQEPTSWSRNTIKTRAHTILSDLWTYSPEIFILVALSVTPTKLGTLKSDKYLQVLLRWWNSVHHPKGLQEIINHHSDILPPRQESPPKESPQQESYTSDMVRGTSEKETLRDEAKELV
jgi:hypothetical protein